MVCAVPEAPPARRVAAPSPPEPAARTGPRRVSSRRPRRAAWSRLAPAFALVLLGPLSYHRALTPGWAIVDYDLLFWIQPYYTYLADAWRHGRWLPLWNSQIYLGAPFLANIQAGVMYPPNLLLAFLPATTAINWLIALHAGLAGAGMYAYTLVALRTGRAGSAVAGIVYMLNSLIISHVGEVNLFATLAWTPWLMLAADRVAASPAPRRVAALAAAVALVILAGHTQFAYFAFFLTVIAAASRLWGAAVQRRLWRRSGQRILLLAGGVTLGAGLAALQLTATVDLLSHSVRGSGLPLPDASTSSLPLRGFLGDLLADYTFEHSAEFTASVGAAVLPLIALALVARWRRPRVVLWALLGLVALVLAFGPRAGLYDAAYVLLPGFKLFRVPARTLTFTVVAASILAAYGVQAAQQLALARQRRGVRPALPLLLGAVGLAALPLAGMLVALLAGNPQAGPLAAYRPVKPENLALMAGFEAAVVGLLVVGVVGHRAALAALPAVVLADLLLLSSPTFPMHPLPVSLYDTPTAAALMPRSADERYLALVPDGTNLPLPPAPQELSSQDRLRYEGAASQIASLRPNLSMRLGTLDADGYDGGVLPIRSYVAFRRPILPADTHNPPDFTDRLLTQRVWDPSWIQEAAVGTVVVPEGVDPNPPGAGALVRTSGTGGLAAWRPRQPSSRAHLENGAPAHVVSDTGERVAVRLPGGASGRLILADTYFPGWSARVDDKAEPIELYAGYVRAVRIPDGASQVVFEYRPVWLGPALTVSVVAALLVLALAVWPRTGFRL